MLDPQRSANSLQQPLLDMITLLEQAQSSHTMLCSSTSSQTQNGLALSPETAASCAQDFIRTIQFIRGIHAAIIDTRSLFPERPTRVLYAGCGPLAPLVIPLMAIFSATEACFTLTDIHEESIESVKTIVDAFGFTGSVAKFEVGDAASYSIEPSEPPDIMVFEIMQACLEHEPQVAIARHFLRQAPDAILIPEEINIELVLTDPTSEFAQSHHPNSQEIIKPDRLPVASVFTLNRETIKSWQDISVDQLPAATTKIPQYDEQQYQLMLFTSLCIYKNHVLETYESGLTSPRLLNLDDEIEVGTKIKFHYKLGAYPCVCGVVCK